MHGGAEQASRESEPRRDAYVVDEWCDSPPIAHRGTKRPWMWPIWCLTDGVKELTTVVIQMIAGGCQQAIPVRRWSGGGEPAVSYRCPRSRLRGEGVSEISRAYESPKSRSNRWRRGKNCLLKIKCVVEEGTKLVHLEAQSHPPCTVGRMTIRTERPAQFISEPARHNGLNC